MIKKEERSEIITVPTISTGPNSIPISVPVPFSVLTQQAANQLANSHPIGNHQLANQINLTNPTPQPLTGQQASVISMSWASNATNTGLTTIPAQPQLRTAAAVNLQQTSSANSSNASSTSNTIAASMPVNAIQNSHSVLSTGVHHLGAATAATIQAAVAANQRTLPSANASLIRPNLNIIQDTRSHQTSTPINNHPLHHMNTSIHHVTSNIANSATNLSTSASTVVNSITDHTANQQTPTSNASSNQQQQQSQSQQQQTQTQTNSTNQHHSLSSNSVTAAQPSQPAAAATAAQQQQFQRLKVEDALSYLDQVKLQFNTQPQVYNDFLDIMKEFKSQSIDTPGVIARVSNLFRGHPKLIVGFNTFLPPGYKIEMQANDQVNVSMPNRQTSAIIISGPPTSLSNNNQSHSSVISQHSQTSSLANNIQPVNLTNLNSSANSLSAVASAGTRQQPINFSSTSNHSLHSSIQSNASQNQLRSNMIDHQQSVSHALANATNGNQSHHSQHHQTNNQVSQPVEFNHAINYVNKIKNRFQGQPDVYKQFLEILHAYQKEQKSIKEGKQPDSKPLTETEVYVKVAKLFQNQKDLLQEFGQFLPESNSSSSSGAGIFQSSMTNLPNSSISTVHSAAQHVNSLIGRGNEHGTIVKRPIIRGASNSSMGNANQSNVSSLHTKRLMNSVNQSNMPSKKAKMTSLKDVSIAEASKLASLNEYSFFDKVRKALKSQDVYENFLRFLMLYNQEILSKDELLSMMNNFLGKHPELLKWFRDFLGHKNDGVLSSNQYGGSQFNHSTSSNVNNNFFDGLPNRAVGIRERERERINSDVGLENIDYNSCKRYGASYRALPKNYIQPKCTGRTHLCKEVLNDIWVSFPSWSEDSTFVTSRKTQYEEYIYRCEDERFELDVVIETNLTAIRVFEALQKKLNRMTPEERNKYKLDDTLGGSSVVITQRAIKRIYGDKAPEIVEGLKKSPAVAVPLVYRRLRAKEEEWREAQKQFNKIWREQNEKYYLKSLDHQSITFKQNDIKYLRSKSLLNEIETIFDERHEQNEDSGETTLGPHMVFVYKKKSMIEETCNLIIHHVKRQTSIHKSDKQKIKQLLKHFVPDLFGTSRGELSDDEQEETDPDEQPACSNSSNNGNSANSKESANQTNKSETVKPNLSFKDFAVKKNSATSAINESSESGAAAIDQSQKFNTSSSTMLNSSPDDAYTLFIVNQSWYLFFRLHYILCDRLGKMQERATKIAEEEAKEQSFRKDSPAIALRLKHKNEYDADNYFAGLIDMVKQLLDGNLDSNQFEDQLREMFGIHAYIAFTLDKVVQNIVRQLQHIVCEESSTQTTELFMEASKVYATGGPCSTAHLRAAQEYSYQKKAESILTEENIYKILLFKDEGKLTIELLDSESTDSEDESAAPTVKWMDYINKYAKENADLSDSMKQRLIRRPLFLLRNIKVIKESNSRDLNVLEKEENIEKVTKSIEISDNTECKFDVNSFKAVYLTDTGSYLYRAKSLRSPKRDTNAIDAMRRKKFRNFISLFLKQNCSADQIAKVEKWLELPSKAKEVSEQEQSSSIEVNERGCVDENEITESKETIQQETAIKETSNKDSSIKDASDEKSEVKKEEPIVTESIS